VALPAFAAARRAAVPCCCAVARAAIDRYLPPAGPTAANPPTLLQRADGKDRRTDAVPFHNTRAALASSAVLRGGQAPEGAAGLAAGH